MLILVAQQVELAVVELVVVEIQVEMELQEQ